MIGRCISSWVIVPFLGKKFFVFGGCQLKVTWISNETAGKNHISAGSGVEEIVDANSLSDKLIQLLIYLDVDADTVALGRKIDVLFVFLGGERNQRFFVR